MCCKNANHGLQNQSTKGFRIVDLNFIYYGEVAVALHLPCLKKSKILRKKKISII